MRYRLQEPDRYLWHDLGQADPDDVVVFDRRSGLTHRVDALAWAVHRLLQDDPEGQSIADLHRALCTRGEADAADRDGLTRFLEALTEADLVQRGLDDHLSDA